MTGTLALQTYVPMARYGNTGVVVKDPNNPKADPIEFHTFDISGLKRKYNTAQMMKKINELKLKYPNMEVSDPFHLTNDEVGKRLGANFVQSLDAVAGRLNAEEREALEKVKESIGAKLQQVKLPPFLRTAKMIPGFDQDGQRAIYDSVYRFSSWLSKQEHMEEVDAGVLDAVDQDASAGKYLTKYRNYITSEREEFQGLKQAGFLWLLTDPAAAAMNLFQGLPMAAYLSQFSMKETAKALPQAYKIAFSLVSLKQAMNASDVALDFSRLAQYYDRWPGLRQAVHDILKPMQTAEAVGLTGFGDSFLGKTSAKLHPFKQWLGQGFATTESLNRIASYLATQIVLENPQAYQNALNFLTKNNKLSIS